MFYVSCFMFHVLFYLFYLFLILIFDFCPLPSIPFPTLYFCPVSLALCPMSYVLSLKSYVLCFMFLFLFLFSEAAVIDPSLAKGRTRFILEEASLSVLSLAVSRPPR